MQACCVKCGSDFYMPSNCKTKRPKCVFCRQGMSPEESRIQNEMNECHEMLIREATGCSYFKPDSDFIEAWSVKRMIEKARIRREADEFFFGTPSSDK